MSKVILLDAGTEAVEHGVLELLSARAHHPMSAEELVQALADTPLRWNDGGLHTVEASEEEVQSALDWLEDQPPDDGVVNGGEIIKLTGGRFLFEPLDISAG